MSEEKGTHDLETESGNMLNSSHGNVDEEGDHTGGGEFVLD